jgi:hypothetical protein
MWRAYGASARVAVVLNGGPLLRPSNALSAFASPVAYYGDPDVDSQFSQILDRAANDQEFLKARGEEKVRNAFFSAMRYAVLCTKHPGFFEEREWRVIYSPIFLRSDRIVQAVETIDGSPQVVCKLPLKNIPEEGLTGLELPEFVERVIIGPSKFPAGIFDALLSVLGEAGVENPTGKIVVSDIPLRQ